MANRTSLTMHQALTETAVAASEMRLIGSFIAAPGREAGMFPYRQVLQLYPTDETQGALRDPFSLAVFQSAQYCYTIGLVPRPEALASAILEQGYIAGDGNDLTVDYTSLLDRLRTYGSAGASTIKEFQRIEALHAEKLQSEQASHLPQAIAEIINKIDGRTYEEKLTDVERLVRSIRGDWVGIQRTLTHENMKLHSVEMHERVQARIGNVYMTYCPHMGRIATTMYPQPGEMVVVSGPSGGGKSIILHQNAEWWRWCGFRVLDWLGEDGADVILARATARWIPDTTYDEIMHGDPSNKKSQYLTMCDEAYERGGEVVYEEQQGLTGAQLIKMIESALDRGIAEGHPYSAVVVDYFQVIDFQVDANTSFHGNVVAAAGHYAKRLRQLAQKYNIVVVVGSQETRDGDNVKTAWAAALTHNAQQWFTFTRPVTKTIIQVFRDWFRKADPITLANPGDKSPFMYVSTGKANRFRGVANIPLLVLGAQQKVCDPRFYQDILSDPSKEYIIPIFKAPDAEYYQKQKTTIEALKAAAHQLNPFELLNPNKHSAPISTPDDFPI